MKEQAQQFAAEVGAKVAADLLKMKNYCDTMDFSFAKEDGTPLV